MFYTINEATGTGLPIYFFEDFMKLVNEEKKAYITEKNAKLLNIQIGKFEKPVAFREIKSRSKNIDFLIEVFDKTLEMKILNNGRKKMLNEILPYHLIYPTNGNKWERSEMDRLIKKFSAKKIGYTFKKGVFNEVYSFEDYLFKNNLKLIEEEKYPYFYSKTLSPLKKILGLQNKFEEVAMDFEYNFLYHLDDLISTSGLPIIENEQIVPPLYKKQDLSELQITNYKECIEGFALENDCIDVVLNLENYISKNNLIHISEDEYQENKIRLYFDKKSKTSYFPADWRIKENIPLIGVTEKGREVYGFRNINDYFSAFNEILEKECTDEYICIHITKLFDFRNLSRDYRIPYSESKPLGITKNKIVVFDGNVSARMKELKSIIEKKILFSI